MERQQRCTLVPKLIPFPAINKISENKNGFLILTFLNESANILFEVRQMVSPVRVGYVGCRRPNEICTFSYGLCSSSLK